MNRISEQTLRSSVDSAAAGFDLDAAARRLAERAEDEGVLDVAYATVDSPFGRLLVAATDRGVVKLSLPNDDPEAALGQIAAGVSPRVLESPQRLDAVRRELDGYFEGRLRSFSTPVDWSLARGFADRVLHVVAAIPYGRTLSYAEVAAEAGNPRAFRAAGTACGLNPVPLIVPCHRVVQSGGRPGNYDGGPEMKLALLELENVLPGAG